MIFLILLLLNFKAGTQVSDIYDILTNDGLQQKREGSQYVVGLYKKLPEHAVKKGANIHSMKNRYGSEFTCIVPRPGAENEWEEEMEEVETSTTVEEVEAIVEPEEEPLEQQMIEEPVVLDKISWFLQNFEGSCLNHDGGYWKTQVCFQPDIPHIFQQHGMTIFDLGKFHGVFDEGNPEYRRLKHVATMGKQKRPPFLQLAFLGGTDGRISLVNIRCAHIYDRVKTMSEPIRLVYLFELSIKLVCNYKENSHSEEISGQQLPEEVSKPLEGSVEEILDETFSELTRNRLDKKSCLYYRPGWFTFEICYQKRIQQYHLQEEQTKDKPPRVKQRITQLFNLGTWDGQSLTIMKGSTPDKSYAKALYIDGTNCDLTGKPRTSTVHYKCNRDIKDTRVELFQELETCVYLFVIATNTLCEHEDFKPPPLSTKEIICYLTNSPPNIAKVRKLGTSDDKLDETSML